MLLLVVMEPLLKELSMNSIWLPLFRDWQDDVLSAEGKEWRGKRPWWLCSLLCCQSSILFYQPGAAS